MSLTKVTYSMIKGAPASVLDFGAVGNGVADDTAAFNAAIAWANAKGGSDRANILGSTIFIPEGRYKITAALDPITVSSVFFVGASQGSTVLLISATGSAFTFGDATRTNIVVGGGIHGVKIEYPSGPSGANTCAVAADYAFSLSFENIMLERCPTFLRLGETALRTAGGVNVDNVIGSIENAGYPVFDVRYGAGLYVSNTRLFVRGVVNPTHPNPMTTVAGTSVFAVDNGSWDTVQVSNCIFERFDQGFSATAGANIVIQNAFFTNTVFDYCRREAFYLEANAVGAAIATVSLDKSCWFNSWEESSFYAVKTGGLIDGISVSGTCAISGKYSVYFNTDNATNNAVTDLTVNGANRLGTVSSCLFFQGGSTGFNVSAVTGNNDATLGWTRPDYGIVVGADCDRFSVTNCALYGPVGGYSFAANASGSKDRLAANNVNAGYAQTAIASVPATTVTYTNTTPFTENWTFSGGTITGGYSKNGIGISGALSFVALTLAPGDSYAIGYSVAPGAIKSIAP